MKVLVSIVAAAIVCVLAATAWLFYTHEGRGVQWSQHERLGVTSRMVHYGPRGIVVPGFGCAIKFTQGFGEKDGVVTVTIGYTDNLHQVHERTGTFHTANGAYSINPGQWIPEDGDQAKERRAHEADCRDGANRLPGLPPLVRVAANEVFNAM